MTKKITNALSVSDRLLIKMRNLLIPILLLVVGNVLGQTAIPNTTAVTQNFDGMNAGIDLPGNWRMHARTAAPTWSGASSSVLQQASSGSPATGATYNFGSSASERAVGAMTSGSFASPNNLLGFFQNTNASNLTSLTISYDAERYRINSAAASVQFFYSTNGTAWTAVTAGDIATTSFPTGTSAYNFTTGTVINKSAIAITGLNIATNGSIYLRWNINTTGSSSQGIAIDNISVTAGFTAAATPVISATGVLSTVNTTYGTASAAPTSFNVSGADMTAGILVTPPTGYQVSLSSGSGYAATVTVGAAGTIVSTPVYVRLSSTATVAGSPYSGNIVLSSAGATGVNVATVASTVVAKALTITGITANNKLFDGNTTTTLSGSASLVGIVNSDVVTLGGSPVATFASSAVGTGIAVSVTGYTIGGAGAGNYSLTPPSLTADITSSPSPSITSALTASAIYGTAASTYTITASESPTSYDATGLPPGLTVNTANGQITGTPTATGVFNVTISATNAGGTGSATLVYTITPKNLTVTGATATSKVYDRTNAAAITGSTLVGVVGADIVTISTTGTFATVNFGTAIAVTSTQTLGGADAAKYTVTLPAGLTADISTKALTIASAAAANKTFDGTNTATITGTLTGVIAPDVVTVALTGTFASTAIANGIVVTSTSTLGGADAANYTLTQPTGLTANITSGPTTLVAGDVAVVAINSANPDKFSIVLLKAISTGTVINFTDNGFTGTDTTGRIGEGFLTYTANADLPIGSILTWNNGMTISGTGWSSNAPSNLAFNGSGDQLFVFQGNTDNWASQSGITLIYGLNYGVALSATSAAANTVQPNAAILPATAFLNLPTSTFANGYYSSTGATSTAVTLCGGSILADLVTSAKWFGTSSTAAAFPAITYLAACPVPTITGAATATAFTTTYGTASTAQTFSISGVNLTANLVATAPTGFEVASDGATYGATASFAPTSGTASGTLSLRLKNNASVSGSYDNLNVVLSSTGATDVNITTAASGNSVSQKSLTITGISIANKQYDTTTTATIIGTAALSGVESADTANVILGGTPIANFNDNTVGTAKPVTVSGYAISGSASSNYSLTQPSGLTADISATPIPEITSAATASAVYGEVATTYTITATATPTSFNATELPAGLTVDTTTGAITGTPTATPGVYNVNITATNAGGTGNATLVYTITPKNLTVIGVTADNKVYDGTNTATLTGGTLNGIFGADVVTFNVSATFSDANVGIGKTVTTNYVLTGADASKYTVTQPSLTGDITQASQTITFAALANKTTADVAFALTATATSGLTVSYVSSNTAVATIAGNTVTIVGVGTTTITASQAGDSNYSAATDVNQSQVVVAVPTKFTTGNLVVARIGSGAAAVPGGGVGAPVYLDEYSTTGTSGYSVALPTATVGNVNRFVESSSATSESQLSLSVDGQYLTIGGYDTAVGAASAGGSSVPRVIARISNSGTVATTPIGLVHTSGFRSVTSTDGSRFWTAGNGTGVATTPFSGSSTTVVAPTTVASTQTNLRTVAIYGNQLYYSTGSTLGTGVGIYQVGTGLPTTSSQTVANKMAGGDPYAYYMVNRGGTNWNCYVAYATGTGIYKWSSSDNRATWTAQGNISTTPLGVYGIVAQVNGSDVDVYASTPSSIVKLTDTAAFNATIAGTVATIVTAPTNTIFRGLAFAPSLLAPVVTNATLTASGTVDTVFTNFTITAVNSPASYNATGLPTGLSINTVTGVISGTPTQAGTFNVVISATNDAGTDASKTLVITIAQANQTITFTALGGKDISDPDFALTASSPTSAINPITYSSSDTSIATIIVDPNVVNGYMVHLIGGTGNVTITASQAGNADYNAATSVDQILNVSNSNALNQTITFDALAPVVYGDAPFTLTASATSNLTVTFTSSNAAVATVVGNTVTIVGVGSTNITAAQAGDASYNPAANVIQSLTVTQKQLTITGAAVTTKVYDNTNTATVTEASLSGIVGADVVTFSGTATFNSVNAGTNIDVTTNYTLGGADAAKYTLLQPSLTGTIDKAEQVIVFTTIQPKTTFDADSVISSFSVTQNINPVTYVSSDPTVATIVTVSPNVYALDIISEGFTIITASQAGSDNYNAAPDVNQTVIVTKVLYRNQFEGVGACPTQGNTPSTDANITGTALSRTTIACTTAANVFNSNTLNATANVNDASYIEFALTANAGYKLKLTSLSFFRQASATAPNQLEVRYSTDNFVTSTSWGAAPLTPTAGTIAIWDFADFSTQLGGTVTFRIYPYGTQRADLGIAAASASGSFRLDDVTVNGSLGELITWDGTQWSNVDGPTNLDDAEILGNYNTNATTGNGTFTAKKLTVTTGVLTVATGTSLTVNDEIVNNVENGIVVQNNANLLQVNETSVNSGTGTTKVFRNASMKRQDYVYWSAPVAGQNLLAFSPLTITTRFYELNEATNAFVALTTSNFIPGKGYSIRAPNTYSNTVNATFEGQFTGVLNNGSKTTPLTNTNKGYNLIGNPYASPIDANEFLEANAAIGTLYFWAHVQQGAAAGANYASFNGTGSAAAVGGAVPNGTIQTGQGFLVKTNAAADAIFLNSMRVDNHANQFFRNANVTEKNRLWFNLANNDGFLNQTLIGYVSNATNDLDLKFDGKLIETAGSKLYSLINDGEYVIQGKALPFEDTDEVALGFKTETDGNFSITLDQVDGLFAGEQNIFLKDNVTGVVHNIKETAYTFASNAGTFNNRFAVVYQNAPLGIENPTLDGNSVIVFKQNGVLNINAGTTLMQSVKIFDIRGRLLFERNNVNATATNISNLNVANQVLVVQITSEDNKTVSKKVVY